MCALSSWQLMITALVCSLSATLFFFSSFFFRKTEGEGRREGGKLLPVSYVVRN